MGNKEILLKALEEAVENAKKWTDEAKKQEKLANTKDFIGYAQLSGTYSGILLGFTAAVEHAVKEYYKSVETDLEGLKNEIDKVM